MKRNTIIYTWLTDIHLNFLEKEERDVFYQEIMQNHCDRILISGDMAEAPTINSLLLEMANAI